MQTPTQANVYSCVRAGIHTTTGAFHTCMHVLPCGCRRAHRSARLREAARAASKSHAQRISAEMHAAPAHLALRSPPPSSRLDPAHLLLPKRRPNACTHSESTKHMSWHSTHVRGVPRERGAVGGGLWDRPKRPSLCGGRPDPPRERTARGPEDGDERAA